MATKNGGKTSHHYRDKCVFAFYAEIQDGRQKWWENDFCEKLPVDYAVTRWVKNFVKTALSYTVSEKNVVLCFAQKFKMATKNGYVSYVVADQIVVE